MGVANLNFDSKYGIFVLDYVIVGFDLLGGFEFKVHILFFSSFCVTLLFHCNWSFPLYQFWILS